MTDTPEAGWRPDPDGGDFNRWFDGKKFTKRVQGEPPKASVKKKPAPVVPPVEAPEPEPNPIPYPKGSVRRSPKKVAVPEAAPVHEPQEPDTEPEEAEQADEAETPDATPYSTDWPLLSTIAAATSGLGIVGAFLLPLGRLPLVIAALGLVVSVIALVLAIVAEERRIVAVWGVGLGAIGVIVGVTISMLG